MINHLGMAQSWEHSSPTNLAGFDSRTRHYMWVELVVGSHPYTKRFFSGFPLSSKTNIFKFRFDLESEGYRFVSRNRLLSVTFSCLFFFIY